MLKPFHDLHKNVRKMGRKMAKLCPSPKTGTKLSVPAFRGPGQFLELVLDGLAKSQFLQHRTNDVG